MFGRLALYQSKVISKLAVQLVLTGSNDIEAATQFEEVGNGYCAGLGVVFFATLSGYQTKPPASPVIY